MTKPMRGKCVRMNSEEFRAWKLYKGMALEKYRGRQEAARAAASDYERTSEANESESEVS